MSSQVVKLSCFCYDANSKLVSCKASLPSCSLSAFYHSYHTLSLISHIFPTNTCFMAVMDYISHSNVLCLQAETVRLRKNVVQQSSTATQAPSPSVSQIPSEDSTVNFPPMTIAYLILALIFGVVIGKFIV